MQADIALQPAGKLTLADVIRFSYFHYARRVWILTGFCVVFALFGIVVVISTGDPQRLQNPGSFYLFLLVFAFLQFVVPYVSARRLYAKLVYLSEPMRFLLTSERVRLEGPNFSGEMTWPLVHSVYETKNAFLIYQTSQLAWILPKRFFWGEEHQIERCRELAKQCLRMPKLFHESDWLGARF